MLKWEPITTGRQAILRSNDCLIVNARSVVHRASRKQPLFCNAVYAGCKILIYKRRYGIFAQIRQLTNDALPFETVMHKVVIENHTATYPDPIRVNAGDTIRLSGKTDIWDGYKWLWAEGPDGKEGWLPDVFVASKRGKTYAARNYSAMELSCQKGDVLLVMNETHGWAWCQSRDGAEGWVPSRNLSPSPGNLDQFV